MTDSRADALFRAAFAEWAVNGVERDYGWDYSVEVFRNGTSTGVIFHAQLKGSRETAYSADTTFISQSLERESADYLARQLQHPTFLFHADVTAQRLFWSAIQLDQHVLAALEKGQTESITVRIATANDLPADLDRFLRELVQSQAFLASRILLNTKATDFVAAMSGQPAERIKDVAEDFHEKAFRLELDAAHDQLRDGNVAAAIAGVKKVLAASASYVVVQFNATIQLGELETVELMRSSKPQRLTAERHLATAQALCTIAKRSPKHLHLYARTKLRAAELDIAVHDTFGLLMSWRGHTRRGEDSLWIAVLSHQLTESLLAAHRKYRQALRLANAIARSGYRWVTPRPIVDIALGITKLGAVLESAEFKEPAREYRRSAFELMKFSAAIATENKNIDELYNAVAHARMLAQDENDEVMSWIRSIINDWAETSDYRKNMEELLSRWKARRDGAVLDGDVTTTHLQIHHNILTSAGIDPTVEPWPSLIEIAIKDDDPTRVLIECEHKAILLHPRRNIMLDRLCLEHANPKIITCEQHNYALDGPDLDSINERFQERYCGQCNDKAPRPVNWTFYSNDEDGTVQAE